MATNKDNGKGHWNVFICFHYICVWYV